MKEYIHSVFIDEGMEKTSDKIISFFIPHHTKKKTLFANIVLETLIRSIQISDIAVIRFVAEEEPTLSTIKIQFEKDDLLT